LPTVNLPGYCLTVEQTGWQEQITRSIAWQIRRHRLHRKLSAQKLADRCEQLGFAIPRSVIANLENGYREAVSVAELLVLAQALEVPPVLLVAPLDSQKTMELLPGRCGSTAAAVLWLTGQGDLRESPGRFDVLWNDDGLIPIFLEYERQVADLRAYRADVAGPGYADIRREIIRQIRKLHSQLRRRGVELTELPDPTAEVDDGSR
jgi:transcriptional regulator with XRE-family HTH domain